jgi:hypothetical protein
MSSEVKTIPLRLDRELYLALANYALANDMSRTAVIRECLAAKFTMGKTSAANVGVDKHGESQSKTKGKRKRIASGVHEG